MSSHRLVRGTRRGRVSGVLVRKSHPWGHAFAQAAGIPRRAFDHDHYDIPERKWHELVALGAEPVSVREMVERLRASGLRVTQKQKRGL